MCATIIKAHGGKIKAENKKMEVHFPVLSGYGGEGTGMNGNKYKILIIEDDEHINNLVATLLEANGYQTLSAYSCEDGMMMYASHRPDLVVLDLGLPDQDGMTF